MRVSEHLPKLAATAKHLGVIRGMTSREGEHGRATQLLHTGQLPGGPVDYPALGSMVAKHLGDPDHDLPGYVTVNPSTFGGGVIGAGFLGPQYAPMAVSGISDNPNARADLTIDDLKPAGPVAASDVDARRQLLAGLQGDFEKRHGGAAAKAHAASYRKAQRMIDNPGPRRLPAGRGAGQAPRRLRPHPLRPGLPARPPAGRARCLVRRGQPRRLGHARPELDQVKTLSQTLDPAFATLLSDLKDRGRLDDTLVVWMGEFGRTPAINNVAGRDHFPAAWSTVLAGGGVKGGQVIGGTSKDGMTVADRPVSVADFLATVFTAVGVDPKTENKTWDGRPIALVKGGSPIEGLVE